MPSFAEIAAPLALLLPMAWSETASVDMARGNDGEAAVLIGAETASNSSPAPAAQSALDPDSTRAATSFEGFKETLVFGQIRIEQRVIVRISPRGVGSRRNMLARLPRRANTTQYKERKAERCVPVNNIAGVETGSGNRLLLFMQDAQILSLNLEKACRAKDFYSGFYVEQNKDGKLCVDRDTLQSRNGARCDIERMMELVAIED
ncbi:MAG: hypothetical protein AAFY19_05225 [Pseudomonadota bacterium]